MATGLERLSHYASHSTALLFETSEEHNTESARSIGDEWHRARCAFDMVALILGTERIGDMCSSSEWFYEVLEEFLTPRIPTTADVGKFLPRVWWELPTVDVSLPLHHCDKAQFDEKLAQMEACERQIGMYVANGGRET